MNRLIILAAAALLLGPAIAHGQTQTARTYQGQDGQTKEAQGTFCVADTAGNGCPTGGAGASTPTGTAGSPNSAVVSVQGVPGGTNQNVAVTAALPAGTNSLGTVGLNAGSATIGSIANTGFSITGTLPAGTNAIGSVSLNAGSNIIGNVRLDQTTPGTSNGVTIIPNTAAALGIAPNTVASVSSQTAKAAAGNFYALNVENAAVSGTYAVLYNATSAPTAGASLATSSILWHFLLASGQSMDKVFAVPVRCSAGCIVLYTTSLTTFTAPATAPLLSTVMVL